MARSADAAAEPAAEARPTRALAAAVFAACVFAVSQPLFQQLGGSPEFLGNHHLAGARLWLFVLAATIALPAAVVLAAGALGRLHRAAPAASLRLGLFAAASLLALVALRHELPDLGTWPAFALAAMAGAVVLRLHTHRRWARELGVALAWLAWLVPVLFLLRPEIRPLLRSHEPPRRVLEAVAPTPVVLVVWDELPVTTLMTADGDVDARWFPGFARLAATATWYRNTTTPGTLTAQAIPAITTSSAPARHGDGESSRRPTVFQLLADSHSTLAFAAASGFLPPDVPRLGDRRERPARWRVLLDDLRLVYLHLTMPAAIRASLPSVSAALGDFRATEERSVDVYDAIAVLGSAAERTSLPLFVYLHVSLPHHPWVLLPSGARYRTDGLEVAPGLQGVAGDGRWTSQPWQVAQAFQRHLLQTQFTDRLMADLIDRLEAAGSWSRALVVVTADHGASFEAGTPLRSPTPGTVPEIAAVPLFVKLPGQTEPRVDDRPASTLDVLPTLAEALGVAEPWPMDGISLLAAASGDRQRWVRHQDQPALAVDADLLPRLLEVARRRRALFAADGDHLDPFRIGPYSQLVGRSVADFSAAPPGQQVVAERTSYLPADERLEARLAFDLGALGELRQPTAFAIAVDGCIRATSALFPGGGPELSAMLPEDVAASLDGADLALYRVDVEPGRQPELQELATRAVSYALSADGRSITDSGGARWSVDPRAFEGEVQVLPLPGDERMVLGWSVDAGGRPPARLVAFADDRSIASARGGVPSGDFFDYLRFDRPGDQIFYVTHPPVAARYFVLGDGGEASELRLKPAR